MKIKRYSLIQYLKLKIFFNNSFEFIKTYTTFIKV